MRLRAAVLSLLVVLPFPASASAIPAFARRSKASGLMCHDPAHARPSDGRRGCGVKI